MLTATPVVLCTCFCVICNINWHISLHISYCPTQHMVSGYGPHPRTVIWFLAGTRELTLIQNIQTKSGDYPAFPSPTKEVLGVLSQGLSRQHDNDHSFKCGAKFKNKLPCTSTPNMPSRHAHGKLHISVLYKISCQKQLKS